jgi:hypothetical protein
MICVSVFSMITLEGISFFFLAAAAAAIGGNEASIMRKCADCAAQSVVDEPQIVVVGKNNV